MVLVVVNEQFLGSLQDWMLSVRGANAGWCYGRHHPRHYVPVRPRIRLVFDEQTSSAVACLPVHPSYGRHAACLSLLYGDDWYGLKT